MSAGRRVTAVCLLGALAAAVLSLLPAPRDPPARAVAERLYREGLDAMAQLDSEGALRFLVAALRQDPTWVTPALELAHAFPLLPARHDGLLDSLAALPHLATAPCIRWSLATTRRLPAEPLDEHLACGRLILASSGKLDSAAERELFTRLARGPMGPWETEVLENLAARRISSAAWAELAGRLERRGFHTLTRAVLSAYRSRALHAAGRHRAALAVEADGDARFAHAAPGVRLAYATTLASHGAIVAAPGDTALDRHVRSVLAEARRRVYAVVPHADPLAAFHLRMDEATRRLDEGDLAGARAIYDTVITALADGDEPAFLLAALARRGRAASKAGDLAAGEADLLRARTLGHAHRYWAMEVEHNLLHLYDAAGRLAAARDAGERFWSMAAAARPTPISMIAARDLAEFFAHHSDLAAAEHYAREMIRDIDRMGEYRFYAGEYYEQRGELEAALRYYQRAAEEWRERSRTLAGLARVAEALGDEAAAHRWASAHDRFQGIGVSYPEDIPLLPGMLVRLHRFTEAARVLDSTRHATAARSAAAAWAALTVVQVEVDLHLAAWTRAAARADSAVRRAGDVGILPTRLRAQALGAYARLRGGLVPAETPLRALEESVRRARPIAVPALLRDLHVLAARGYYAAGRRHRALAHLAAAADVLDRVTTQLREDDIRAGYREGLTRISDLALEIVRSGAAADRAAATADWSQRRKQWAPGPARRGSLALAALRDRGAARSAVVDYLLSDSSLGALVVRDGRVRTTWWPVPRDSMRALVARVRAAAAPRVGDQVDASRAALSANDLARLHALLLEPLDSMLRGVDRLTIVPDDVLWLVPFAALAPSADTTRVLAAERAVRLAPSLADAVVAWDPVPADRVLLVAPATGPGAAGQTLELEEVRRALPPDAAFSLLHGPAATGGRILAALPDADIVHFATHARPNDHTPAFAYLEVRPDGGDEGHLYAHRIRRVRLSRPLVVLSACETAAGPVARAQGPLSLARAFLRAGAGSIVGTLWPIPAPGALLDVFYREIAAGSPPPVALQRAQQARHARGVPATDWAPFVAIVTAGR